MSSSASKFDGDFASARDELHAFFRMPIGRGKALGYRLLRGVLVFFLLQQRPGTNRDHLLRVHLQRERLAQFRFCQTRLTRPDILANVCVQPLNPGERSLQPGTVIFVRHEEG